MGMTKGTNNPIPLFVDLLHHLKKILNNPNNLVIPGHDKIPDIGRCSDSFWARKVIASNIIYSKLIASIRYGWISPGDWILQFMRYFAETGDIFIP